MKTKVFFLLFSFLLIIYSCDKENNEVNNTEALPSDAPMQMESDLLPLGPVEEYEIPLNENFVKDDNDNLIHIDDSNSQEKITARDDPYSIRLNSNEMGTSIACGANLVATLTNDRNKIPNEMYNHFGFTANLNGADDLYTFRLDQRSVVTFNLSNATENLAMALFRNGFSDCVATPQGTYCYMTFTSVIDVTNSSSNSTDLVGPVALEPGIYTLVVDSAPSKPSNYRLRMNCSPVNPGCVANSTTLLYDNFEDYTLGNLSPQAFHWSKWNAGSTYDAQVLRSGSSQYSYFNRVANVASNNQPNSLLRVGAHTSGSYALTMKMWIYQGRSAYFNMQKRLTPGNNQNETGALFYFRSGGNGQVRVGNSAINFTYPHNQWMDIRLVINITTNHTFFYINGVQKASWPTSWAATGLIGTSRLEGFQFYPYASNSQFYIDDICFSRL